jgi:hypothetical protein
MYKKIVLTLIISASFLISSCSSSNLSEFQTNDKTAPFDLFHLFDGYPALKAAWDSVPGGEGNRLMAEMLRDDIPVGAEFMHILSFLLERGGDPGLGLLDDLKQTTGLLNDTDKRLYGHSDNNIGNPINSFFATDPPETLVNNFYSLLDEITNPVGGTTPKVGASVMGMTQKILDYVLKKDVTEIEDTMNDLMDDLRDPTFKTDFADLMDLAAPLMAMADYPMWVHHGATPGLDTLETDYARMNSGDSVDSELGNSAKGVNYFMSGMFDLLNGETIDRDSMYDLFDSLNDVLADPVTVQKLFWNMSNYFTPGGYLYGTLQTGNNNVDTNIYSTSSPQLYSDAGLSTTVRELLTGVGDALLRDDRRASLGYHTGITSTAYPIADFLKSAKKGYINWDTAQIKESLYDLMRVDMFGRDRQTDPEALSASFLEHLLYLGAIGTNYGYEHKANANEVVANPTYDAYSTVLNEHGHGKQIGFVTLNDVLFSIQSQKNPLAGVGNYELGFDETTFVNKGKDRTFRSKKNFTIADRAKYKFPFSLNYQASKFLTGPIVGDFGVGKSLNGGNVNGDGGNVVDGYMPYSPNGKGIKDMTSFTFAAVIRTCWEGEGPYYYKDPSAPTASINGFTGKKYLRPDGRIYALVNDSGTYFYPPDGSNDIDDDSDGQRENRYHATFNTDYYMIEQQHLQSDETEADRKYYVPIETPGPNDYLGRSTIEATAADGPRCRTYSEIVAENYAGRGCDSQEEAMFRNFQWLMNEKKIVFILPLWAAGEPQVLFGSDLIRAGIESAVFQVLEANGLSGFGAARKFRANSVWAKANTSGASSIPGDYRFIIMATPIRYELYLGGIWIVDPIGLTKATSAQVYLDILGKGAGLPGALAHNIYAISRFAFPRSPMVTSGLGYTHYLVGSKNVSNPGGTIDSGFSTSDDIWKKRNSLMPMFVTLLAPLFDRSYYNSSSDYNNALLKTLEGLNWVVKPLIYFNYDIGTTGVAKNSWQERLYGYGSSTYESEYLAPYARALVSDWDIYKNQAETIPADTAWMGSWKAQKYYTPADVPTLLSVLTDSDTSPTRSNKSQRADGLLAKLVAYPEYPNRPSVTETPQNWTLSDSSSTAIDKICAGLEQITTGLKGSKARGTLINEQMSNGTLASIKQLDPAEWRFQKRARIDNASKYVDLDLDDILNKLVGKTPDKGLNKYHDTNDNFANGVDWTDLNDTISDMHDLASKFLVKNGENVISEYLFNIIDVMAQHRLTPAQIKGMQYTLAKMLAYFDDDTDKWILQGEDTFAMLLDLLTAALPNIDTELGHYSDNGGITKGKTYKNLLSAMKTSTKEGALVPWIVDTVTIRPYSSRDLLVELPLWLDSDLISGPNTKFYSLLSQMLGDMGDQIEVAPTEEGLLYIYQYYGFQGN